MIPSMKMIREQQCEFLYDKNPHKLGEVVDYISNLYNLNEEEKRRVNTGSVEPKIKFRIRRNYEYLMVHGFVMRTSPATFQATDFIDKWIESNKHELDNNYINKFKNYYPELMKKTKIIEKVHSILSNENEFEKTDNNYNSEKQDFFDFLISIIIDYNVPDNKIRNILEFALDLNYSEPIDVIPLI